MENEENEEGRRGVNALFVGMQMSTRHRARVQAHLCPMHNTEVLIIMVMSKEIRPMQMRRIRSVYISRDVSVIFHARKQDFDFNIA